MVYLCSIEDVLVVTHSLDPHDWHVTFFEHVVTQIHQYGESCGLYGFRFVFRGHWSWLLVQDCVYDHLGVRLDWLLGPVDVFSHCVREEGIALY